VFAALQISQHWKPMFLQMSIGVFIGSWCPCLTMECSSFIFIVGISLVSALLYHELNKQFLFIQKKKLRSRQKKLKAYDLSTLTEFLPELKSSQQSKPTAEFKLNSKSRQKLMCVLHFLVCYLIEMFFFSFTLSLLNLSCVITGFLLSDWRKGNN